VTTIGQRIVDRRGNRTQQWLAGRVGVTQVAVSYWETDQRVPELQMVAKLADALRCDPGWLAFGNHAHTERGVALTRTVLYVTDCDWGGCGAPAVAVRWDEDHEGFLPVCDRHTGEAP
jgi:transcriptional regulator with XRE-family HTH domain